jgi:hypothetical protein
MLPVFRQEFIVVPGMVARRAFIRCLFPFRDISAVEATPLDDLLLLEYGPCLNIGKQAAIPSLVLFFGG